MCGFARHKSQEDDDQKLEPNQVICQGLLQTKIPTLASCSRLHLLRGTLSICIRMLSPAVSPSSVHSVNIPAYPCAIRCSLLAVAPVSAHSVNIPAHPCILSQPVFSPITCSFCILHSSTFPSCGQEPQRQ